MPAYRCSFAAIARAVLKAAFIILFVPLPDSNDFISERTAGRPNEASIAIIEITTTISVNVMPDCLSFFNIFL